MSNIIVFLSLCFISSSTFSRQIYPLLLVTEHLPPYQIKNIDGVDGFATEIVKAGLKKANIEYDIKVLPWSNAYNIAKKRKNTCIYPTARLPLREKLFTWIQPIFHTNSSFYGLSTNSKIKLNSVEDAKRYNVAVLKNDITHQILLTKGFSEGINLFVVNNSQSLLKLLTQRKSIDLILIDDIAVKYRAIFDRIPIDTLTSFISLFPEPVSYYLACSLNTSPTTINKLSTALYQLNNTTHSQQIINRWLNSVDSTLAVQQ